MIRTPTSPISSRTGMCFVMNAARGAAIAPPINKPTKIGQAANNPPSVSKNVTDSANVTKNSDEIT